MIVLRLIAVFIVTVLMTGCTIKDLKADVKTAKSDIRDMKAYLAAFPPPNECQPPGTPQARICYYKLSIKALENKPGWFKGHVAPSVVGEGEKACKDTGDTIQKNDPEVQDYKCLSPRHYTYVEYGFKIDGDPKYLEAGIYEFSNIPHTEYLRLGKSERTIPY